MPQPKTRTKNITDWRKNRTWATHRTTFMFVWKIIGHIIFWPTYTVTWEGLENLPESGPCILASNHASNYDSTLLYSELWKRWLFFMAKMELYEGWFLRWLLHGINAFPVKRGEGDIWAIGHAGRVLKAGRVLGMFPEGTRSKTGVLQTGKTGTAKLALHHKVPVVPVAVLNTNKIANWYGRVPVTVKIGQPIDLVSLAGPRPYSQHTYQELTTLLMQRIAALMPPELRGIYG